MGLDFFLLRRPVFLKWPRQFPYGVLVEFGKPLSPNEADIATVREELLKLGERAYGERPIFKAPPRPNLCAV